MKRLAIFFLIIIIIVVGISYMYLNYKANYYQAQKENRQFESYDQQEVYGADLATVINKAIDAITITINLFSRTKYFNNLIAFLKNLANL